MSKRVQPQVGRMQTGFYHKNCGPMSLSSLCRKVLEMCSTLLYIVGDHG